MLLTPVSLMSSQMLLDLREGEVEAMGRRNRQGKVYPCLYLDFTFTGWSVL